MFKDMQNMLYL